MTECIPPQNGFFEMISHSTREDLVAGRRLYFFFASLDLVPIFSCVDLTPDGPWTLPRLVEHDHRT